MNVSNEYWAGLFDGEGSIVIGKRRPGAGSGAYPSYRLQVVLVSKYKEHLRRLASTFGGTTGLKVDAGYWQIGASNARDFLVAVLPYLREKKLEAKLAIQFWEGKNHKTGIHHKDGREAGFCEMHYRLLQLIKKNRPVWQEVL